MSFDRQLPGGGYSFDIMGLTVFDKLTYADHLSNRDSVADDPRLTFVQGDICDGLLLEPCCPVTRS